MQMTCKRIFFKLKKNYMFERQRRRQDFSLLVLSEKTRIARSGPGLGQEAGLPQG